MKSNGLVDAMGGLMLATPGRLFAVTGDLSAEWASGPYHLCLARQGRAGDLETIFFELLVPAHPSSFSFSRVWIGEKMETR